MKRYKMFEAVFPAYFVDAVREIGARYSDSLWDMGRVSIVARQEIGKTKSKIITQTYEGDQSTAEFILTYTAGDLYQDLARNYGISVSRLRAIIAVVDFFGEDAIREYGAILPFSHFEFAKTLGDKAMQVLEFDVAQCDRNNGQPPSVEWLYTNFAGALQSDQPLQDHQALIDLEDAHDLIYENLSAGDQPDSGIPYAVFYFMKSAGKLINSVESGISKMDIDGNRKELILAFIAQLRELSNLLQSEFEV